MLLLIASLGLVSFTVSWLATAAVRRLAPRVNFVDKPGHRKIHHRPMPLGGGVAIFLGFALPIVVGLVYVNASYPPAWLTSRVSAPWAAYWSGAREQTDLAVGLLVATFLMHLLGLWDDKQALGPYSKLFIQLAIITGLVVAFPSLRALTFLGPIASVVLTVLWIGAITNAFNFLDNMDGLSAGVAAVAAAAFLATAVSIEQWFVAAALALLLGAALGFLCFNFAPATIFMGDSGSLILGLVLGTLTIRTTYLPGGTDLGAGWYAVFAPVIVLALPLYDLLVVSAIRISRGKSPFKGDTNHFSHRLVARGMSKRTAVLCLYLVTAATAVAAVILPHAPSTFVAVLIFLQTVLVLGVVALLEQHPLPSPPVEVVRDMPDTGAGVAPGAAVPPRAKGQSAASIVKGGEAPPG